MAGLAKPGSCRFSSNSGGFTRKLRESCVTKDTPRCQQTGGFSAYSFSDYGNLTPVFNRCVYEDLVSQDDDL